MRHLDCADDHETFYLDRANYYDAVDFDDSVYRTYRQLVKNPGLVPPYELVLIDEFQDFNRMEAGIIDLLADRNAITIAGDDDQALYSQLRSASWDYIRSQYHSGEYEIFDLPFCMRCTEVVVEAVTLLYPTGKHLPSTPPTGRRRAGACASLRHRLLPQCFQAQKNGLAISC